MNFLVLLKFTLYCTNETVEKIIDLVHRNYEINYKNI